MIDWSKAPEWARYYAKDADGVWCWYEEIPDWAEARGVWASDDRWEEIDALNEAPAMSMRERPHD
jgi:hypothetical protein